MSRSWLKYLLGLAGCLPLIAGCAGNGVENGGDKPMQKADVAGPVWTLTEGNLADGNAPLPKDLEITFQLREGVATGFTGCNRYTIPCTLDGQSLQFGPMTMTKRACPRFMAEEQTFIAALAEVTHYIVADNTLRLSTADGRSLVFHRGDDPAG